MPLTSDISSLRFESAMTNLKYYVDCKHQAGAFIAADFAKTNFVLFLI